MAQVTLYIKDGCPYCAAALKHYGDQGFDIRQHNIKDPGVADKALALSKGQRIVPVIVENGKVSLGFGGG